MQPQEISQFPFTHSAILQFCISAKYFQYHHENTFIVTVFLLLQNSLLRILYFYFTVLNIQLEKYKLIVINYDCYE